MAGYIGTTPVPQATQHRESFTATGGQTSFATVGYTPQFIDVYLNGVKLAPADFTATNGSDVVLASGATASDILEIVAYTPFEVANQTFTGTTTATNLTVTGAFTSQGIDDNADAVAITIDSSENVGIGTSSPDKLVHLKTSVNNTAVLQIESTATDSYPFLSLKNDAREYQLAAHGPLGDVFTIYDGTAGSHRFVIDSSGNVGIGTSLTPSGSSASSRFITVAGSGDGVLQLTKTGSGGGAIASAAGTGMLFYTHTGTVGSESYSERMRIDASGNLLVGTTTTANLIGGTGNDGVALTPNHIEVGRSGGAGLFINRYTSDGDIAEFRKDGTTVGSIGASGGEPYIGNGDTGLKFNSANDYIQPFNVSGGSGRDNAIDIGNSGNRFKDLYLSGGVYLGGTGAANKLDDYEEGTWTPTLNFGGNATGMAFTTQSGSYVRVGQVVTAQFRIELSAKGSSTGNANFGGLPFNATSVGTLYPAFYGLHHDVNSGSGGSTANVLPIGQITRGGNSWNYYNADSTTAIDAAYFNNNTVINGTVTFRVN